MNRSQIHNTTFLWVGISVKTNTFFAFLEKHLAYRQWYTYHRLGTPGLVDGPGKFFEKYSTIISVQSVVIYSEDFLILV